MREIMKKTKSIKTKILVIPMIVMIIMVTLISAIAIKVTSEKMLRQTKIGALSVCKQLADKISENKSYSNIIEDMLKNKLMSISNTINHTQTNITDDYIKKLCVDFNVDEINRSEEHTSELQSRQYLVC